MCTRTEILRPSDFNTTQMDLWIVFIQILVLYIWTELHQDINNTADQSEHRKRSILGVKVYGEDRQNTVFDMNFRCGVLTEKERYQVYGNDMQHN